MTLTCSVLQWLEANKAAVVLGAATVYAAAVGAMPIPAPNSRWYAFFYDFNHLLLSSKNTRLTNATIPTPPETAPAPK